MYFGFKYAPDSKGLDIDYEMLRCDSDRVWIGLDSV